jgi:hypothetical protein
MAIGSRRTLPSLAEGGGGHFRAHGGAEIDAVAPVEGLEHQRHGGRAAAAEDNAVDRHAVGILPFGSIDGHCEAGAVKRALAWAQTRPQSGVQSWPVQSMAWAGGSPSMPSHQTSPSSVRPTLVKMQFSLIDSIARGLVCRRCRGDAEVSGFRVDGVQLAVLVRPQPGDVVADDGGFPTGVLIALRRDEHGEVGLAAGGREGDGEIGLARPPGFVDADDEHVLGHPLVFAGDVGGDAQGEALLAEQRVAAVAGADRT